MIVRLETHGHSFLFSFGIVMWEVLTRQMPYMELRVWDIRSSVLRGYRPAIPAEEEGSAFARLMSRCWAAQPNMRPGFAAVEAELNRIQAELPSPVPASPSGSDREESVVHVESSSAK